MGSQGSAHGRFQRALARDNLRGAEIAAKEMPGPLSLLDALDYLLVLARLQPERYPAAAVRWHGRLELESSLLTLSESQLALSALAEIPTGNAHAIALLKGLLRRVRPTAIRRFA